MKKSKTRGAKMHRMTLHLRELGQLFNTMDSSPFHEKDLDDDAADFILSWAQEFHRHDPVKLVIQLETDPGDASILTSAKEAVRHYFGHQARLNKLEFQRLMKRGRLSLMVGLGFLVGCFLAIGVISRQWPSFPKFLSEGLTIAGWVAMWKPLEIYLYDWWPLRRRGQIFCKLSRMPVEIQLNARKDAKLSSQKLAHG